MFDTYRHDSDHMGESSCNDVDCRECPLGDNSLTAVCAVGKSEAFDLVKSVYEWAQRNPIITNIDKLKEIFGEEKAKDNPEVMKRAYVGTWHDRTGVIRQLTYRECLRLMGFPDDFKVVVPNVPAYRQIGNSIVVNVLEAIFKEVLKCLKEE